MTGPQLSEREFYQLQGALFAALHRDEIGLDDYDHLSNDDDAARTWLGARRRRLLNEMRFLAFLRELR